MAQLSSYPVWVLGCTGRVHVCQAFYFIFSEGRTEGETDDDSLDDGGSLSLGDDCSGSSSDDESDPYDETIHQQRRGKKRVLSESPIKAPDHLESLLCKKSRERRRTGIARFKIVLIDVCVSDYDELI